MYLILEHVDNDKSAGNQAVGYEFDFPSNIKKKERVQFFSEKTGKILHTSEVKDYWFCDYYFYVETKNSRYEFKVICD